MAIENRLDDNYTAEDGIRFLSHLGLQLSNTKADEFRSLWEYHKSSGDPIKDIEHVYLDTVLPQDEYSSSGFFKDIPTDTILTESNHNRYIVQREFEEALEGIKPVTPDKKYASAYRWG